MKRRNVADGKIARRPVKRTKIPENFYGSSLVYIKLLVLWGLVLLADYFLEFRFEYLWPFWLFLRTVYDSFKYQGMAFSVFFICIALTSDMICFLFIPVHWLFFAASTYVWVQYVWQTEKGICLPTVFLWLLFLYIEASIRIKEFKAHIDFKHLPFHLDLCRPFAAHCIGYPVVTLGFGFKSYVGYRMRQRRQREVLKENEYYYEFCREALPPGPLREDAFNPHPSPKPCSEDRISDHPGGAVIPSSPVGVVAAVAAAGLSWNGTIPGGDNNTKKSPTGSSENLSDLSSTAASLASVNNGGGGHLSGTNYFNKSSSSSLTSKSSKMGNGVNGDISQAHENENHSLASPNSSGSNGVSNNEDVNVSGGGSGSGGGGGGGGGKSSSRSSKSYSNVTQPRDPSRKNRDTSKMSKDELFTRMESDIKRLKIDLQISRNKENELRDQIISYMSSERYLKSEISNLQVEKSVLESRISGLLSTRAGEKATLSNLEKRLADERKQKADFQIKLETERKTKKEAANAERTAQQNQTRSEVAKLEAEINKLRHELYVSQERCSNAEQEVFVLRKCKETHGDPEVLLNALKTMQDKNGNLEKSLSAETKLKMDLFSALGEAKRELAIRQNALMMKDKEITELKAKIAEVLAVMPTATSTSTFRLSSFAPSTLSLDLPPSTDLSFTGAGGTKLSALGLSNLDDKLSALDATGNHTNIYTPASLSGSAYSPKTNGNANDA